MRITNYKAQNREEDKLTCLIVVILFKKSTVYIQFTSS